MVGDVVTNESNMASYFPEEGNLNGSIADMTCILMWIGRGVDRGSGDLFELSDRSNKTDPESIKGPRTTGRHFGFERDYNSHTAFRGVLRHYR